MKFFFEILSISFLLLTFTTTVQSQSNWEYGIGVSLHYGDYSEDVVFENDIKIPEIDKSVFLPSFKVRAAYKLNETWKLSLNPTIAWKGADDVFLSQKYRGTYFDFILLTHYAIIPKFHIVAGPAYSRVLHFMVEEDGIVNDVTNTLPNKQLFSGQVGFVYDVNSFLEINFHAFLDIDEAIQFSYTDDFGTPIGNINLRNQYLELGLVFRK